MSLSAAELKAIGSAAQWYARLHSGIATDADHTAWHAWLTADPAHHRAWQRMTDVGEQMARVPGALAAPALLGVDRSRRQVLRSVVVLASAGSLGWLSWRSETAQSLFTDYRTAVGERREYRLADGSRLLLNTDTSVNLRFDDRQRVVELLTGEIIVTTAVDAQQRPFKVVTRHGEVLALGTRFVVRSQASGSEVAVLEKAVEVSTSGTAARVRLEAGQHMLFSPGLLGRVRPNDASIAAWEQGSIIAINRPLSELLADLSRYRSGVLRCDSRIADLKVSGAFPIDDTDRALAALESGFALRVTRYSRFWVNVSQL
ncbi:FecR domain-containing protein [Pseudomonas vancouverensis]|uniref:Fec operon regulator FecR n=1 Tax=Pseudomonas vancouverensis TaxID=95300 RepID=A0A1H2N970_PSEVA|nr:FecR domain-containing protein [Pseudomonas vancouverensis]KAB0494055.1 fec operon regulator FecR [Pseudomonas vancouverensis]TDB61492.1 fec operon regulator FecR [Pseudomonas vancouverensis]SDV02030.1 FecR family protein [Pseudomonas vancouverensis]